MLVSIPLLGYPSLPAASFAGKTVLDTGNYYPQRDGRIEALDSGSLTDSEYLAQHLPGARVVKVFNNIFYKHLQNLARPAGTGSSGTGDRTYLPIAGDHAGAKIAVVEFLDSIGYGADDAGPLADGWRQQPGTPVYGAPYGEFENEKGTPADAAVVPGGYRPPAPATRAVPAVREPPPGTVGGGSLLNRAAEVCAAREPRAFARQRGRPAAGG